MVDVEQEEAVHPALQWVMTLAVNVAKPADLGECYEGWRSNYPITGGTFKGEGLSGIVLAGGCDQYLLRGDGVGELDARYSLLTDRGEQINIHNVGRLVIDEEGQRLSSAGVWPLKQEHYVCTCTPRFQVAKGRLDWLSKHMFIGRIVYPSDSQVRISCYRLA